MQAVILVGGEGARLRPLTYELPKPMVPICGKPFAQYQIELLKRHGIEEIIFSCGYKWNAFEEYFGDGSQWGLKIHFVVENHPLGTGGAIKNVEPLLNGTDFLVFNGDILSQFDLTDAIDFHKKKGSHCTIALTPVEDPSLYGVVEMDKTGKILNFVEKPKREEARSNRINAGLYVMNPQFLKMMEKDEKYSIEREIFPKMLENDTPMYGYNYPGYWMDIGTPYKYLAANLDVLKGDAGIGFESADGIVLSPGAKISEGVDVKPPVWVGGNTLIGEGCRLEGPLVIGGRCRVKAGAVLKGALLWDCVTVGEGAVLDGCLVGGNCVLGEGVKAGSLSVIGGGKQIGPGTIIPAGERIGMKD